jgi:riboflavin kinase / FMN adenylyltransferase
MDVVTDYRELPRPLVRPAIAIGNFDGVHRGHVGLLAATQSVADGGELCVVTFEPHPAQVLAPQVAPLRITTAARKLELLAAAGVDVAVVIGFTPALAAMTAHEFTHDVLAHALDARQVVVGADFTYGHRRAGTTETLCTAGAACGFAVTVLDPIAIGARTASSTRVRAALAAGDLVTTRELLGRAYDVDGVVVRGAGRGTGLGIPTANVAAEGPILPSPGIYAVTLVRAGDARRLPAVASLGTNPTFVDRGDVVLEVHVLDFDDDLYGERVRVSFEHRLRDEARYDGVAALLDQIAIDVADTRRWFATR